MKNKLTKLFIAICAIFSFALMGLNLMPKAEASAFTATTNTYNITNTGNTFYVTKGIEPSDIDIATDLISLEAAFDAILADPDLGENDTIEIKFNVTISTEEQITLNRNFIFSGMLNTDNASSLFICENTTANDQLITCNELTITNTNETLNDFSFFNVTTGKSYFTLFNTHLNFNAEQSEISHAIKFDTTENNVLLKGKVSHDTTYFYNYTNGTLLHLDQDNENGDDFYSDPEGNAVSTPEKIKIAVPYDANNATISNEVQFANSSIIKLVENNNFFTASNFTNNNILYASTTSNLNFNTSSGEIDNSYITPSSFYYNSNIVYTFPDATQITREHHQFIGWFGQIVYNSETYYFDQICLEEYVTNGSVSSTIPTYFKTDLNDFELENSFTNYSYLAKGTAEEYAKYYPAIVMAENGQAPTFIAKWKLDTYTVSFNTDRDTVISDEIYDYGSKITEPVTIPTKTGYTFDKWYKDAELAIPFDFETETVPAENITIYAGYIINSYTITFVTNTTETINPITYNYLENITEFETLSKEGHTFAGWFLNDDLTEPFVHTTMPAQNITIYAKWSITKISVYFNTKGGTMINEMFIDYGSFVQKPTNPEKTGFTFHGWYFDYNCSSNKAVIWNAEDKLQITSQTILYAKWTAVSYNLVVYTYDNNNQISNTSYAYNATISLPTNLIKSNYTFSGWYADSNLTTPFTINTMPAENVTVYAKWIAKQMIVFDESPQSYTADTINPVFKINTTLKNFVIKYKVNNEWVNDAPTDVGTYDVMIYRNEDNTYAKFEKIISGGYVVEPIIADYTWLIAILFSVFALEIIVSIAVRILRKLKRNMVISSLAIISGNTLIPSNQIVLIIISAICVVAGFVVMCYQLVKLHRTLPLALVTPDEDNDSMEKHFKHSEKVLSEDTHSYSAEDIENLLNNDTVGNAIKEKHKLDELEKEEIKEKVPIAPIAYSEEHDNMQKVEDDEFEKEETSSPAVEIVEDEFVANDTDDNERLYNSDDPFLRKDPNDYNSNKNDN